MRPGADFGTYYWIVNKLILKCVWNSLQKWVCIHTASSFHTRSRANTKYAYWHTTPPQVFCWENSAFSSVLESRWGEQKWFCSSGYSSALGHDEGFLLRKGLRFCSWAEQFRAGCCRCADAAGVRRKSALFL